MSLSDDLYWKKNVLLSQKMNRNYPYRIQSVSAKWLYLVILVLTLLSISGLANPGQTKLFAQQTTRAASKPKAVSKCITYQRALCHTNTETKSAYGLFLLLFDIDLSKLHSEPSKVKATCCNECAKAARSKSFYHGKTIPQSSEDEPAIPLA
jgi:hypothetical protein